MSLQLLRRWSGEVKSVRKTKVLGNSDMIMPDLKIHLKMEIICDVFVYFFLNVKQMASGWTRNTSLCHSQKHHLSHYWHRPGKVKSVSKWRTMGVKNPHSAEFLLIQGDYTKVKIMLDHERYICKGRCDNKKNKKVSISPLLEISAIFMWLKKWILTRVAQGLSLKYGGKDRQ